MMTTKSPAPLRGITTLASGTVVSRALGFIRDMLFAYLLGPGADAFLVAFRVPNFFRRLLAEGSLSLVYAEQFAQAMANEGKKSALRLARQTCVTLLTIALPLCLLFEVLAGPFIALMAPGFTEHPALFSEAKLLLQLCIPYIPLCLLIAVIATTQSFLGNYLPQALSSFFFNIGLLCAGGAAIIFSDIYMTAYLLCAGIIAGGLFQLACSGWKILFHPSHYSETQKTHPLTEKKRLRYIIKKTPAAILGASGHQLQVIVGTILASFLAQGGITALYFSERLLELPLGIAGVALGLSLTPQMTSMAARKEFSSMEKALAQGISLGAFLSFPAAAGLFSLSLPIVTLLFGHGAYTQNEVIQTARCLAIYAFALPPLCAVRPLLACTTALGSTKRPVIASILSIGVTVSTSTVAIWCGYYDISLIALGITLGAWVNMFVLSLGLWKKNRIIAFTGILRHLFFYVLCAFMLAVALSILPFHKGSTLFLFFQVAFFIALAMALWIGGFLFANNADAHTLFALLFRRKQ